MSADARTAVLDRIRAALNEDPPASAEEIDAEWQALPRAFEQVPQLSLEAKLELLETG